jgi:hypothetical protein
MKKCSITAVFALTWLMMMPPPKMPPVKDKSGNYEVNLSLPVSRWVVFSTYRNEAACRGDLKAMPSYFVCIDKNSPALKAASPRTTAPAAAPAPSRK